MGLQGVRALSGPRRSTCVRAKGEKTWPSSKQKDEEGFQSWLKEVEAKIGGIKNGQSRLMSRYVLVLPLGQTASELLSQRSLAWWRTESCPGASGCRSEERKSKQAWKTGQTEETGTTEPSCRCFHKTRFQLQVCVHCCFYCSRWLYQTLLIPMELLSLYFPSKEGQRSR